LQNISVHDVGFGSETSQTALAAGREKYHQAKGQVCAINGLAAYPDFGTAEAKTVVQAKPIVRLVL
jgi:hypothetical protein